MINAVPEETGVRFGEVQREDVEINIANALEYFRKNLANLDIEKKA